MLSYKCAIKDISNCKKKIITKILITEYKFIVYKLNNDLKHHK